MQYGNSFSGDEFTGAKTTHPYSPETIFGDVGDLDHAKTIRGTFGNLRVPSLLQVMVNQVVAQLPDVYKSAAAFERDALTHRALYWLESGRLDSLSTEVRHIASTGSIYTRLARQTNYETTYNDLKQAIQSSASPQARMELQIEARALAENITDFYWQQKFEELGEF